MTGLYGPARFPFIMRESAAKEKTHLPQDTYEEWVRSQKEKPTAKGRGKKTTGNSYEEWVAKKVETRAQRTAATAKKGKADQD